jgi:hypothetical protein
VAQQWTFAKAASSTDTAALTIKHRGSGACLTRGGLSTTNVWGRHLHGGDYALLFVNVGVVTADVTCDMACWAAAGLEPSRSFAVRDLWQNKSAGILSTAKAFTARALEPGGGVAMFRLTPLHGQPGFANEFGP